MLMRHFLSCPRREPDRTSCLQKKVMAPSAEEGKPSTTADPPCMDHYRKLSGILSRAETFVGGFTPGGRGKGNKLCSGGSERLRKAKVMAAKAFSERLPLMW